MSLWPRLHKGARAEVRAAVRWYEERQDGLGREFYKAVDTTIDKVARGELPGLRALTPSANRDIRWARVRRFPYKLYFEAIGTECVIDSGAAPFRRQVNH